MRLCANRPANRLVCTNWKVRSVSSHSLWPLSTCAMDRKPSCCFATIVSSFARISCSSTMIPSSSSPRQWGMSKHLILDTFYLSFIFSTQRHLSFSKVTRGEQKQRIRFPLEYIADLDCLCISLHHCIHLGFDGNSPSGQWQSGA